MTFRKSLLTRFQSRKPFDSLRQIIRRLISFPTDITGRVMFLDVEGFLRGGQTLSSFTEHLTEFVSILTSASFA